jgi:hypothetical protein
LGFAAALDLRVFRLAMKCLPFTRASRPRSYDGQLVPTAFLF